MDFYWGPYFSLGLGLKGASNESKLNSIEFLRIMIKHYSEPSPWKVTRKRPKRTPSNVWGVSRCPPCTNKDSTFHAISDCISFYPFVIIAQQQKYNGWVKLQVPPTSADPGSTARSPLQLVQLVQPLGPGSRHRWNNRWVFPWSGQNQSTTVSSNHWYIFSHFVR